jgi:hypothetical protein
MRPPGRRSALAVLATLAVALLSGCGTLRFKEETVVLKFGPEHGELHGLLAYEGFHSGGERPESLKDAKDELAALVASGEQFYLTNSWLFHVRFAPDPDDDEETAALKGKVSDHLAVHNGSFFLNGRGELCWWQVVDVRDVAGLAHELNAAVSHNLDKAVTEELARARDPSEKTALSAESLRMIQRAARSGHEWLKVTLGRVAVEVPMTPDDADKLLDAIKNDPSAQGLTDPPGALRVEKKAPGLVASVGDGKSPVIRIAGARDEKQQAFFEKELIDFARTSHKAPFDKLLDAATLIRRFEERHD